MSEPAGDPGPEGGLVWRFVEAQHQASTMKLVDDPDEQATLEALLDESKPPVPDPCRRLHYLLFTPFRYPSHGGSRFRRAGRTPAVFYAAERIETAAAEVAFHRLLVFADSPGTPWPRNPLQMTAFEARWRAGIVFDLTRAPFAAREAEWTDLLDYSACQALADAARSAGAGAIRSKSARDPAGGTNVTLLSCDAFAEARPTAQRSWRLMLQASGASMICEAPHDALAFGRDAFAADPRIAGLAWERG